MKFKRGKETTEILLVLLLTMNWFKWRCHANDAGALYRVIITARKVVKS